MVICLEITIDALLREQLIHASISPLIYALAVMEQAFGNSYLLFDLLYATADKGVGSEKYDI